MGQSPEQSRDDFKDVHGEEDLFSKCLLYKRDRRYCTGSKGHLRKELHFSLYITFIRMSNWNCMK